MTKDEYRQELSSHVNLVRHLGCLIVIRLLSDLQTHDESKWSAQEEPIFREYTPKLKQSTYLSEEYKQDLKQMQKALDHHYRENNHHPQHFGEQGVAGMTLIDLTHMMCDWVAASQRHEDGDPVRGATESIKRFQIEPQLAQILLNTVDWLLRNGGLSE